MGFGVLILSSITMLRDFGFVTLIDMTVSLGGSAAGAARGARHLEREDLRFRAQRDARLPGVPESASRDQEPAGAPRAAVSASGRAEASQEPRSIPTWPPADRQPPRERKPPAVIDTRPYRWTIGIFGLVLVIAFSVYRSSHTGWERRACLSGKRLHYFVAPLATSSLNGDANVHPRCDPARPNPRALNVCGRTPLVLGLFVTGSTRLRAPDRHAADSLARSSPPAASSSPPWPCRPAIARRPRWSAPTTGRFPFAYDPDGAVGALYGVAICPMVELAAPRWDGRRPSDRKPLDLAHGAAAPGCARC